MISWLTNGEAIWLAVETSLKIKVMPKKWQRVCHSSPAFLLCSNYKRLQILGEMGTADARPYCNFARLNGGQNARCK